MKLVTFLRDNYRSIGVLVSGTTTLIDIQQLKSQFPSSMIDFVSLGDAGLDQLMEAVTDAPNEAVLNLADVELLAPIPVPRKNIMCVGRNYHEHAKNFMTQVLMRRLEKQPFQMIQLYLQRLQQV